MKALRYKLKQILAILDSLPVMVMIVLAILSKDNAVWTTGTIALMMFFWHYIENSILSRLFIAVSPKEYVGHMEWPNIAFTGIILLAFIEAVFRFFRCSIGTAFQIGKEEALSGCLIAAAGILLRVWAYVTLKEEFVKAPGSNITYIRKGPYRFLHHPANTGFFMIGMGVAMGLYSAAGCMVGLLFLLPTLIYVSHFENRFLKKNT